MKISSGAIPRAQKVCLYGVEGIGKTTFASDFPNPLFIDTEGGTSHMDVKRLEAPTSWSYLLQQVEWVKANPTCCDTLVIDTADWAEMLCVSHVCAQHGISGIEGLGWGKGYTYLAEEFGRLLNKLSDLIDVGINVVLTAHAQIKKFDQPEELGSYDRWELKLQKKTAPLVKEWADLILFANYEIIVINTDKQGSGKGKNKAQGGNRVMYTSHHPAWDAKNRHGLSSKLTFDFAQIAACIPVFKAAEQVAPAPVPQMNEAASNTAQEVATPAPAPSVLLPAEPEHLKPLRELMATSGVTDAELQDACAFREYTTASTTVSVYPADFTAWLVAGWEDVLKIIQERKAYLEPVPFE